MKVILRFIVMLSCGALLGCDDKPKNNEQPIRLVSWGGQFQSDLLHLWVAPAAKRAGVQLAPDAWDGEYSGLTTRIRRGINAWDIVHVEAYYLFPPDKEERFLLYPGLALPLIREDFKSGPDVTKVLEDGLAWPILEYGYVLATNGRDVSDRTWATFFDLAKAPGRRGVRDFPIGNIEIALLAKGLDPVNDLYEAPADKLLSIVEEALRSFDGISAEIRWWRNGDQLQSGLVSGEYTFAAAWSGRVLSALRQTCPNALAPECPLKFSGDKALISTDWWIIPKNAPNAEGAVKLLTSLYSDDPAIADGARAFSRKQGYQTPVSMGDVGTSSVGDEILKVGSSRNPNSIHISEAFWSKNFDVINKAWLEWRARTQR